MFDKYHLTTIQSTKRFSNHECVFQLFIRNDGTFYLPPDFADKIRQTIKETLEFYLSNFGQPFEEFIKEIRIANSDFKTILPIKKNYPIVEIVTKGLTGLIFESALINRTQLDLIYTTRLYRIKQLCDEIGISVVADFALRRAPSIEAANRFSEIAIQLGYKSSNMNLYTQYPTEIIGTFPHAFVQYMTTITASDPENENSLIKQEIMMWQEQIYKNPNSTVVLPDTYDWRKILGSLFKIHSISYFKVRVDSDHEEMLEYLQKESLATKTRVEVIVSGDMNEERIKQFKEKGLFNSHNYFKVIGLAVGTQAANNIKPLSIVYKLVEVDGKPVMKKASGKQQIPGRKFVFYNTKTGETQLILGQSNPISNTDTYARLVEAE